jgi:hypothetical protein
MSQRTPIRASSIGRVQKEQVENTWSIRYAPLATMTTRAPQAIYLE